VTDAERIKELEKLIEWHKQDTHDAMEWKRELEAEMLNNAKTAQLIIDGLEAKLEKAVGALKRIHQEVEGTCVRKLGCVECEARNAIKDIAGS